MKFTLRTAFLTLLMNAFSCIAQVDLVIDNATILSAKDAHSIDVKTKHWVAIKNGMITEVSSASVRPKAKKYLNAHGKFLMPGLTDSHTHLRTMPGLDPKSPMAEQMQAQFLNRQGRNYLYYGVTQVVDPSSTKPSIDAFNAFELSPDAYFCGAMPIYKGYSVQEWSYGVLQQEKPYFLYQPSDPIDSEQEALIANEHQSKQVLEAMKSAGAICGKIYYEDGFGESSDIPNLSVDDGRVITSYAAQLGLPIMVHANATDMQQLAVKAGVNIMGHGLWNWIGNSNSQLSDKLPQDVKQVLDKIIEQKIVFQPTLEVMYSLGEISNNEHTLTKDYHSVVPASQLDWYRSDAGQWFAREMQSSWRVKSNELVKRKVQSIQNKAKQALTYVYNHGGLVLLGSDTPPAPTYISQPGLSTNRELKLMHDAGVDLVGLLAAATVNNAKAYNLSHKYGQITVGFKANLLLLNSNPLVSVDAYDDIDSVILSGKVIKRDTLDVRNLQ